MTDKPILVIDYDETLVDGDNRLYPQVGNLLKQLFESNSCILWLVSFNDCLHQCAHEHGILKYFHRIVNGFHKQGKLAMIRFLCEQNDVSDLNNCILFDDVQKHIDAIKEAGGNAFLVDYNTGLTNQLIEKAVAEWRIQRESKNASPFTETKQQFIVVGTETNLKLRAVRETFPEFKVIGGQNISSGISDQPIGLEETILGSQNRALHCKEKYPNAYCWIGIENGLVKLSEANQYYHDVPVSTLHFEDGCQRTIVGCGVPTSFSGMDDLERYQKEINQVSNRAVEYFTQGQVTRLELILQTLKVGKNSSVL